MKAQVALLTPGVGKLSYRIHRRGAATNWDMSHLFKGASKTLVSIAAGGSTESLQSQMEGELLSGGFTHLHQELQTCHSPLAIAKQARNSLSILVPDAGKAISLPRWHSHEGRGQGFELYLLRCKDCTPAHSEFPPN